MIVSPTRRLPSLLDENEISSRGSNVPGPRGLET